MILAARDKKDQGRAFLEAILGSVGILKELSDYNTFLETIPAEQSA
jgi:hypothetical protein